MAGFKSVDADQRALLALQVSTTEPFGPAAPFSESDAGQLKPNGPAVKRFPRRGDDRMQCALTGRIWVKHYDFFAQTYLSSHIISALCSK